MLFCSLACRAEALSSYHRVECRIQDLLYASGMSVTCLLSLRLTTRLSVEQLLELRPRLGRPPAGPYTGDDYGNVYRLVAHAEKRTAEALFPLTLMAVFMLRCLQFQGYFGDGKREDGKGGRDEVVGRERGLVRVGRNRARYSGDWCQRWVWTQDAVEDYHLSGTGCEEQTGCEEGDQ